MHKVVINGVDLSDEFIISESQYPIYSKSNIYIDRAENTPHFSKMTDESKSVTLVFNKKDQCMGAIELQHYMEKFVATKLKTKEPTWIEVNGRFMYAILHDVSDSDMYQGKVTVTFMNIPGKWYGVEKIVNLGTSFTVSGVEESRMGVITITPSTTTPKVTNKSQHMSIRNALTTSPIIIDLFNKRVTQVGLMSEIDLDSDFFKLELGANNITPTNCTGSIKYREVVAL